MIKKCSITNNVMPSAVAETKELNGITITCDGNGTYTLSGTASKTTEIFFDLPYTFTSPISMGQGGNGTLSLFNTYAHSSTAIIRFYKDDVLIDDWIMNTVNRTTTNYVVLGNKEINKISFRFSSGTTTGGTVSPMFTNDGQLPAEFVPHLIWNRIPYRKYHLHATSLTSDEITTDGSNVTAIIDGNMSQSGTPSPSSPIQPNECGNKTVNLLDISLITSNSGITNNGDGTLTVSGYPVNADQTLRQMCPDLKIGDIVYLRFYTTGVSAVYIRYYESSTLKWSDTWGVGSSRTMTEEYLNARVGFYKQNQAQGSENAIISNLMICKESSINYQPYGYKLDIQTGSITTPVYLGQVQSIRKIKKLVLTGNENWIRSSTWKGANTSVFYYNIDDIYSSSGDDIILIISDRFMATTRNGLYNGDTNMIGRTGTNTITIRISDTIATTLTDFKAYLLQQYSAGTPVIIWYVLAVSTITTLNEPIRKIGDYTDGVSVANLPTTLGTQTFTVNTTLQPSDIKLSNWWETIGYEKYYSENRWIDGAYNKYTIGYWENFTISEMETKTINQLQGGN